MPSTQKKLLLRFISCGSVKDTPDQTSDLETRVDRLDTVAVEDRENCRPSEHSSPREKCQREKNYDTNETRARRRSWFRRNNKVAPIVLSTAEEGSPGTQRGENAAKSAIFEDKPVEASNDHVVLGFCEAQDSFMQRQNGALALQSFATCARLNENFMRSAPLTPNQVSDENISENQNNTSTRLSCSAKFSTAWKSFKNSFPRRDNHVITPGEAGPSNENTSEMREKTEDSTKSKKGFRKHFRIKLRKGNSSKVTNKRNEPVREIQEVGEHDSTFDRDLYMQINNLAVTHDTCQSASRDPFFVQEEIPTLSAVPMEYLAINLGEEDCWKCAKKKSRIRAFLARKMLKRQQRQQPQL